MENNEPGKEAEILNAVKRVLTEVIKDTATKPGMRHPLSAESRHGIRDCLLLISQREQELVTLSGRRMEQLPRFRDAPLPQDEVTVSVEHITKSK